MQLLHSDSLYVYDFIYATGCLDTELLAVYILVRGFELAVS
jgi:hypothetical protein